MPMATLPPRSERTPQRIGGRRLIVSKTKRVAAVKAETQAHSFAIVAARQAGVQLPRAVDALKAAETQLGLGYAITGCRCTPGYCYKRDCSGLIYFAVNTVAGTNLCGSSFSLAALGRDHGTEISEQEAIWTPGALGIRCAFCDPNRNGSNGHVVFMKGDGQQTVEEGGHATGCYRGHATGRGFDFWMKHPGLDYDAARLVEQELDVFTQTQHYDAQGNPTGPTSPPTGHDDESSIVRVSDDGSCIEAKWGATIAYDQPADQNHPFVLRRWYPNKPIPAGARFTGVAFRSPTVVDPIPGGVALVSDGTTRKFRLS